MKRKTITYFIETVTKSNVPLGDNMIYTKKEFEKTMEKSSKIVISSKLKLTNPIFTYNKYDNIYHYDNPELTLSILETSDECFNDIYGDIALVMDGFILVNIYNEKINFFEKLLNQGFRPIMIVNCDRKNIIYNEKIYNELYDIKLVSYEMIKPKDNIKRSYYKLTQ